MIAWYVAILGPPFGAIIAVLVIDLITWYQEKVKGRF